MKTISAILVALCISTHWANAQTASVPLPVAGATTGRPTLQDTPYAVVSKGANQQVWQKTTYETTPDGKQIPYIHKYTELATGLHYWEKGQWIESKEEIDILPNGTAAAIQGQHQAYFPGDIYQGVVELVTPDGIHLQSRPLGLSYDDGTKTVLIAELKDSVGQLVGPNQVIYPDAFTDFKADLRFTYTKAGFEQDIILREQPLTPESFGLNPATARLQVLSEFFNPPQPAVTMAMLPKQAGITLSDENLDFGAMKMLPGRTFLLGSDAREGGALVSKSWVKLEGRQFLVEEVPVEAIAAKLEGLPLPAVQSGSSTITHTVSRHLILPPPRLAKTTTKPMLLARASVPTQGLVLDYQMVNGTFTNYTFQGDTTYYISGTANLYGTNTFEGGTVIKYTNSSSAELVLNASAGSSVWTFQTGPYRPAIFTSMDENSVGETISGSTGSPTNTLAKYLCLPGDNGYPSYPIQYARFAYAGTAIQQETRFNCSPIVDCQFVHCSFAIVDAVSSYQPGYVPVQELHNVLMSNCGIGVFTVPNFPLIVDGENMTVDDPHGILLEGIATSISGAFTNCIFTGITNFLYVPYGGSGTITYDDCVQATNGSGIYQTVGGGSYYLANDSTNRNKGTTNINPQLLAELKQKTTYPPIVYSNYTFSIATNFSPQAQRDTNALLDLGYHYDPLDYVFGGVTASSNLTFTAGTAMGWFETSAHPHQGLILSDNVTADFQGTVTTPCWITRYNTVQEGNGSVWARSSWVVGISSQTSGSSGTTARFTCYSALNSEGVVLRDYSGLFVVRATDCEFWTGGIGGYYSSVNCTNCLFFRSVAGMWWNYNAANLSLDNCTFIGGYMMADHTQGSVWPVTVVNCAFEGTSIYMNAHGLSTNGAYCDYTAFLTNANLTTIMGGHEVTNLASYNWQSSWLGNYYLPTNSPLIDWGNTNANLLGLYHFTTQTNQVKEANSPVDIGYHYVAVDQYGNPIDTDGDGIPDYLEDANWNGVYDAGDLSDWLIGCFNGLTTANGFVVFTPLK